MIAFPWGNKSEFQITLNQGLPNQWGNFYLVGSWINYWNQPNRNQQFQFGYSNQFKDLTYSISAITHEFDQENQNSGHETQYLLSLSFPLQFKKIPLILIVLFQKIAEL